MVYAEQRLESVGLVALYNDGQADWLEAARKTRQFIAENFPQGAVVRRDDVAKALVPILEVHETLKDHLDTKKLRQKFWIRFFADLIIDRTWD